MLFTFVFFRLRVLRIGFFLFLLWLVCNIDYYFIYVFCIYSFGEGSKLYVYYDNKTFDLKKIYVILDNYKIYCYIWIKFEWSEINYFIKFFVKFYYFIILILITFWFIYCVYKIFCKLLMFVYGIDEVIIGIKVVYEYKYFGFKRRLMFGFRWWEKELQLQVCRR